MLSKEECEQALMNICSSNSKIEDRKVFKDLINEHFELVEKYNTLLTRFNALENPQSYKFEDLKADMYLYDIKKNEIIYLFKPLNWDPTKGLRYSYGKIDHAAYGFYMDFEENRFYPVQMANVGCE